MLRPQWNGNVGYAGPSLKQLLKDIIRDPRQFSAHCSKYLSLKKAKEWDMPGISIFVIAARKPK